MTVIDARQRFLARHVDRDALRVADMVEVPQETSRAAKREAKRRAKFMRRAQQMAGPGRFQEITHEEEGELL